MDQLLSWLYQSLIGLKYAHPTLLYQDISLILKLYPQLTISVTESQPQLIEIKTLFVTCIFPKEYPQLAPIVDAAIKCPILDEWNDKFGSQISNDNIRPQENRLVLLFLSIHKSLIPQTQTPPSIPQKPQKLQTPQKTNVIVQEQNKVPEQTQLIPSLPPNPIRKNLISSLQTTLQTTLTSKLASLQSPISLNQTKLVNSYDAYNSTYNRVSKLNDDVNMVSEIVNRKTDDAEKLIHQVKSYIDSDYNHNEPEILTISNDVIVKAKADACLDTLNLLQMLYNQEMISFDKFIEKTRTVSRQRAVLLIGD